MRGKASLPRLGNSMANFINKHKWERVDLSIITKEDETLRGSYVMYARNCFTH